MLYKIVYVDVVESSPKNWVPKVRINEKNPAIINVGIIGDIIPAINCKKLKNKASGVFFPKLGSKFSSITPPLTPDTSSNA